MEIKRNNNTIIVYLLMEIKRNNNTIIVYLLMEIKRNNNYHYRVFINGDKEE